MVIQPITIGEFLLICESDLPFTMEQLLNGTCDLKLAESALNAPYAGWEEFDRYPLFYEKAAIYCSRIAKAHSLKDGNKRAGFLTMREFALRHGFTWEHGKDGEAETIRAVECIAASTIPEQHFINWVGHRLVKDA